MAIISKLPGAIRDNRQRIKAVNHWENHIATLQPFFCHFMLQTKNSVTSLFFVGFSLFFYQNVGHHTLFQKKGIALGKRGMALEKKGMAPRLAKTG